MNCSIGRSGPANCGTGVATERDIVVVSHQSLRHAPADDATLVTEANNDITEERLGREARLYLASIVNSSDDAIIGKTLEGIITAWNQAADGDLGYTADEVIGHPVTILHPPDLLHEEMMILERMRRGERLRRYETVRLRKDGVAIEVSLTISPILSGVGRDHRCLEDRA